MRRLKIIGIYIIILIIFLVPDLVFELFHGVFELVMEVVHTLFEIVEVTLDLFVEHAFHTDLHQTQIIVFYILFFIFLYWLRRLWLAWPGYYQCKKDKFYNAKQQKQTQLKTYWQDMALLEKIKVITIALLTIVGLFSILFM